MAQVFSWTTLTMAWMVVGADMIMKASQIKRREAAHQP